MMSCLNICHAPFYLLIRSDDMVRELCQQRTADGDKESLQQRCHAVERYKGHFTV